MDATFIPKSEWFAVDKGSTFTKTSKRYEIPSTVKLATGISNDAKHTIIFNGREYLIGGKSGGFETDLEKHSHENTKILILTAIAQAFDKAQIEIKLATGLPINLVPKYKEDMQKIFDLNRYYNLSIDGIDKQILFRRIEVVPESVGAFFSQDKYDSCIVIDVGGLSVDCSEFDEQMLVNYSTYPKLGTMPLYQKISNIINAEYGTDFGVWNIQNVLDEGAIIRGQHVRDFSHLGINDMILSHVQNIASRLSLDYDLPSHNLLLAGGGSIFLKNCFEKIKAIKHFSMIDEPQFANPIGYKIVCEELEFNE